MKKLFTIFTILLLVVSCTKDTDVSLTGEMSGEAVSLTASVVDMTQTKSTLINSWSGGEQVALFVGDVKFQTKTAHQVKPHSYFPQFLNISAKIPRS